MTSDAAIRDMQKENEALRAQMAHENRVEVDDPSSEIPRRLEQLSEAIGMVEDVATAVEKRLAPITRRLPEPGPPQLDVAAETEGRSPVALQLHAAEQRVVNVRNHLFAILTRIEL